MIDILYIINKFFLFLKKYYRIIILTIISFNVLMYLFGVDILYLKVSNIISILLITQIFKKCYDDILDKIYLNIVSFTSIIVYICLTNFFNISPTRILIVAFAWVLMIFNTKFICKKWLEQILKMNIDLIYFSINHLDLSLRVCGLLIILCFLFITGSLPIGISIIYLFFIMAGVNTFTIINNLKYINYGHSMGVRYVGTNIDENIGKVIDKLSSTKLYRLTGLFIGIGGICCGAKLYYDFVIEKQRLHDTREMFMAEHKKFRISQMERKIADLEASREKKLLILEHAKDKIYKAIISDEIVEIKKRITEHEVQLSKII